MTETTKPAPADGPGTEGSHATRPKGRRCPVCGAPERARYRPFCSKRCADVDLGRWLKGSYRIPVDEEPDEALPGGPEPGEGEGR